MKWLKLFEEFWDDIPELEIKASNIKEAGQGLFTNVDIEVGDWIAEFTGELISDEEANKLQGSRGHYLVSTDRGILDVFNSTSPAIKANDARGTSFKNNSEIVEQTNGEVWLVATKRIRAGEEVFCDYGSEYWENWTE